MTPQKKKLRARMAREEENAQSGDEAVPLSAYENDAEAQAAEAPEDDEPAERGMEERANAVGVIRRFRGDEFLILTYLRTSPNPYRDDDAQVIEIYADDRGFEYWIDPQGDVLVQAGPSARVHPTPRKTRDADRRSVGELRAAAVALVTTQVDDFAAKRSGFHPLEDNRARETFFFRWDDFSQPAKESELPPFVQVGLHADGTLASYTNTLRR
jgi:hypothetical protein